MGRLPTYNQAEVSLGPMADQARDVLRRHVMEPLASCCVDEEYGGFLVDFDERWRPVGPHDKSLEHAARSTIVFALLDRVMPNEGCDRLALHGCEFLRQTMWDGDHGGFFARVDRQGRARWDGLKHPHAVTYAVEAFHLCRDLLPPGIGERWVENGLRWLDEVAWDPVHGGYWGSYRADNSPYLEGDHLPSPDGRDPLGWSLGFKEINTQSDALEMLTLLAADKAGARCVPRLEWMTALVKDRLTDTYGVLPYAYRRDWRPAPCMVRVGCQFQTSRRLLSIALGAEIEPELVATAIRLVDFCLASARHPAGGFSFAVTADGRRWPDVGPESDVRQWWVQFEAINALHRLAQHELVALQMQAGYLRACNQLWSFVRANYFDEAHGGMRGEPSAARRTSWSRHMSRRGPAGPAKTHAWKDAYHETATLVALLSQWP